MIQRLLVEVDSFQLAKALGDSSEEVQNKIFRNMPRRAVEMLKEDMRFVEPVDKEGADNVKRVIIDIYYAFSTITSDDTIENAFYAVRKKADEKG
jgi:flagellar motor switch protein FliG